MLLEHSKAGAAVRVSNMAAKVHSPAKLHDAADDSLNSASRLKKNNPNPKSRKSAELVDDQFGTPMQEKPAKNVQVACKKLGKHRQDDFRHNKRLLRQQRQWRRDPRRMDKLRHKFVEQCKRYFGVPYARKYWSKETPEYKSPLFLDCCGLVRQVMRNLERDFGFRLGPWNQAYMYDTLPVCLTERQMRPGDLVFMTGNYVNGKHKKQRHNMMHVEVWLGEGPKTIGARWNNGKVQVFDSYRFNPKSFANEQYLFRSIDTWLMGICKSYCQKHKWGMSAFHAGGKKSVFLPQQSLPLQDQKAGDDDDDDDNSNDTENNDNDQTQAGISRESLKTEESGPDNGTRRKKRNRRGRKATKTALLRLEDRLDHLVARSRSSGGDLASRAISGSSSMTSAAVPHRQPLKQKQQQHFCRRKGAGARSSTVMVSSTNSASFSSSSSTTTPLLSLMKKRVGGGGGVVVSRPATCFDMFGGGPPPSSSDADGAAAGTAGGPEQLSCPVIGDCNSQAIQYVPNLMPKRYGSPLLVSRASPKAPDLQTPPRRPKWFDTPPRPVAGETLMEPQRGPSYPHPHPHRRAVPVDRPPVTARPSLVLGGGGVRGGLLTRGSVLSVVGSSSIGLGMLKKNKSCTDLETLSTRSKPSFTTRGGATTSTLSARTTFSSLRGAGGSSSGNSGVGWSQRDPDNVSYSTAPVWRFSAPNPLENNPLSFSAQFMQDVRECTPPHPSPPHPVLTPTTPSLAATCCTEEEEEEEEEIEEEEEEGLRGGSSSESEDGEATSMSMACDCQECWLEGEGNGGKEVDLLELEEEEEMDTDEELESYCLLDYALEEDTDTNSDYEEEEEEENEEEEEEDDLGVASLSFSYRSEWHMSQSRSGKAPSSAVFPLRPACALSAAARRQSVSRSCGVAFTPRHSHARHGAASAELSTIADWSPALLGNCNNNSSRSQSARSPRKSPSRLSLISCDRPSTSHALVTMQSGVPRSPELPFTAAKLEPIPSTSTGFAPPLGGTNHSPKRQASSSEVGTSSSNLSSLSSSSAGSGRLSCGEKVSRLDGGSSPALGGRVGLFLAETSISSSSPTPSTPAPADGDEKTRGEGGGGGGAGESTGSADDPRVKVCVQESSCADPAKGSDCLLFPTTSCQHNSPVLTPSRKNQRSRKKKRSRKIQKPSESEQAGGEKTGGESVTESGAGGRRGGKRTPGGRPTKLPACSLPANMIPTFFVGGGNGVALVERPLLALGWKRTMDKHDERFKLKWVECKSKINYTVFKEGEQLVNHIPNCKLLTNKLGLLCSLQEYERVTLTTKGRPPRLKMCDFVPETYKLDEKVDQATFLSLYAEGEMWICKPVGMNQGKGIFLLRSREEIDNHLAERDAKRETNKYCTRPPIIRIVQRYITNPLLLEGRKFDIRSYMLIASTVPYLVLFHHGYIRLSCLKYDGNDTNLTTHLTNQFVQLNDPDYREFLSQVPEERFMQKKDPNYKDVKEDTAWTMEKFNDYINLHYVTQRGLEEDWVFNTLTKQMQRIMLHCFNSVKHKLQCKIGYFDLYGLDFMIDTDMKVWLIEVNMNPALHINCEALKEVIPDMVKETLHVSIEAFEKSRKNQPLMPMQSLSGFQVLHCSTPLFNITPRQTRSVSPAKGENPEQQGVRVPQTARAHNRHLQSPPRALPRMSVSTTQVQVSPNASTAKNHPTGSTRLSQTCLPDISHSNTNINQSTNCKPTPTSSTTQPPQPAVVRNVATTTGQQPAVFPAKPAASSSASRAASGSKPATAPGSTVTTPKTASTAAGDKSSSPAATTGRSRSVPAPSLPQSVSTVDVKVGAEDVRLKMTHANSPTSKRHNREKPDRGN